MTDARFDDETLMAYVDGELPPPAADRVRIAIGRDPALAARAEIFAQTRSRLSAAAMDGPAPVPPLLLDRVRAIAEAASEERPALGARVLPFRPRLAGWLPPAIAASVAMVIGWGLGHYGARHTDRHDQFSGTISSPDLAQALVEVPSGRFRDLPDGRLTAVATFRDASDNLCREIERSTPQDRTIAVACHENRQWVLSFTVRTASAASAADYAPASSQETLDAFLAARGMGEPMEAGEEEAALGAIASSKR